MELNSSGIKIYQGFQPGICVVGVVGQETYPAWGCPGGCTPQYPEELGSNTESGPCEPYGVSISRATSMKNCPQQHLVISQILPNSENCRLGYSDCPYTAFFLQDLLIHLLFILTLTSHREVFFNIFLLTANARDV